MVTHAITRLNRAYAVLLGKYEFVEREIEPVEGIDNMLDAIASIDREKAKIMVKMDQIAATAKHLDPSWVRERIRPIYPRKKIRKYGVVAKTIYAVLREAETPLRSREIAKIVATKLGIQVNEREMARLNSAVVSVLNPRVGLTVVKVEEAPIKWAIMPRGKLRPGKTRELRTVHRDKFPPLPRKTRFKKPAPQ